MLGKAKRWLLMLGWAAMVVFFSLAVIGSLPPHSVLSWLGIAFWGSLLAIWVRMGWRGAGSSRERIWAPILVVALVGAFAAIAVGVDILLVHP